jgi:hypothetical protein
METIRLEKKGKLVKVYVRGTDAEYSDSKLKKHGYPNFPPKESKWGSISEAFVFCSKKLPTYIYYDEEKKKFTGTIPFDQDGVAMGAIEGIGNLYLYVCENKISKGDELPRVEISSDLEFSEIALEKPTDIFNYTN